MGLKFVLIRLLIIFFIVFNTFFKYLCPVLIKSENLKVAAIRSRSIG